MTKSRSSRTLSSVTRWPACSKRARASTCKTSMPISSRIRIACSWIFASCSSDRTFGAVSRSNSIGVLHQRDEQLLELSDPGVVDLERLVHVRRDVSSLALELRIGMLANEQD